MQPYDVIVCGDIGVDYSMTVDNTLDAGAVSRIVHETRELGGEAGCRAKFLAERGLRVCLLGYAPAPDGNGRFVENELHRCPGLDFAALSDSNATLYRVSIVTPEAVHQLIYEPAVPPDTKQTRMAAALRTTLQRSPQAVIACQGDWLPLVVPFLHGRENPVVSWCAVAANEEKPGDRFLPGTHLQHGRVPPADRKWKFAVQFSQDAAARLRTWILPDGESRSMPAIATLDVDFFGGLVQAMRLGLSAEDSLEYAGQVSLRSLDEKAVVQFPPVD